MHKRVSRPLNRTESLLRRFYPHLTPEVLLFVIVVLSATVRFTPVIYSSFPVNDGGFVYSMIGDIQNNHYLLPRFASYNQAHIPFSYPPLALYLAAFLTRLGIPLLTILRFLPPLVSVITVILFYHFASLFTKSRIAGLVSAFAFALVPKSYIMIIMGGGLTRSFGLLFSLVSLIFAYRFFTRSSSKFLLLTSAAFALTVLTHPEWALSTLVFILLLGLHLSPPRLRIKSIFFIFSTTFVFCLPWIVYLAGRFGLSPITSAFHSGFWSKTGLLPFLPFSSTSETMLPLFAVAGLLSTSYLTFRGQFFLPFWIIISFISNPRTAGQSTVIPLSIAIGFTFTRFLLPRLKPSPPYPYLKTLLAAAVLLFPYLAASLLFPPSLNFLTPDTVSAMEWVRYHTPPDASFLVLSPTTFSLWSFDSTAEWFPALTRRVSLTTSQGLEWLPDQKFSSLLVALNGLKACTAQGLGCLENWSADHQLFYSYIFISDRESSCCSLLGFELDASPAYSKIFHNPEVAIWVKKSP